TSSNPDRLFFGCQHFKRKGANCKYFVWLDEYVACFQDTEGGNSGVTADPIERIEERIASLETMLTVECKKWVRAAEDNKIRGTVTFILGIVVAFCWSACLVHSNDRIGNELKIVDVENPCGLPNSHRQVYRIVSSNKSE
ncbi:hypothetical protein PIB30_108962, partial [Stylosanthes scabra]|nr:hypothetical protein [Stylosanthes scabra]